MFDFFLFILAMAGQSVDGGGATATASAAAVTQEESASDTVVFAPLKTDESAGGDDQVVFAPLPQAGATASAEGAVVFAPLPNTAATGNADGGAVVFTPLVPTPTPALQGEPQVATGKFLTALEVKPILGATKANWVAVRDFNGQDLVYVTHLWAWRCGLVQMELSINRAPYEIWPMPACHLDAGYPNAVLPDDGLPYRGFARGSVAEIAVRITYDDLTVEEAAFPRNAIMIP